MKVDRFAPSVQRDTIKDETVRYTQSLACIAKLNANQRNSKANSISSQDMMDALFSVQADSEIFVKLRGMHETILKKKAP